MYLISDEIINVPHSVYDFHYNISSHIKSFVPITTRKKYLDESQDGFPLVGGFYNSEDDRIKMKCIQLEFTYVSPKDTILISHRRFRQISKLIADTILHEIIHMKQYRRRKFKSIPDYQSSAQKFEQQQEQSYLGCPDEIDAYSFNIACELIDKFGNDEKRIIRYLNEDQKKKKRKSNSWRMYLKAFDHDHDHRIIKRVKKKVARYIPAAVFGKPYRSKDWISG